MKKAINKRKNPTFAVSNQITDYDPEIRNDIVGGAVAERSLPY